MKKTWKEELNNLAFNGEYKTEREIETTYRFMAGNGYWDQLEEVSFEEFYQYYLDCRAELEEALEDDGE